MRSRRIRLAGAAFGAISILSLGVLVAVGANGQTEADALSAAKAAIEQQYERDRLGAPRDTLPKDPAGRRPVDNSTPVPWPAGIFDEQDAPFPAARYTIANRWQEDFGGRHVVVYAGSLGSDATQGVIVIMVYAMDGGSVEVTEIKVPARGLLRVVSEGKHNITLLDSTGQKMVFSADTMNFMP